MRLVDLVADVDLLNVNELDAGFPEWREQEVSSISIDSRQIEPASLYVAIRGIHADGHGYLNEVTAAGCVAAIVEVVNPELGNLIQLQVPGARQALGYACAAFYGTDESDGISYVAVTGTDGKTSTNQTVRYLMEQAGRTVGSIGTPGITYPGFQSEHGSHTTPDSTTLHAVFRNMKETDCQVITLEASSHALDQDRLVGVPFTAAIFTNLSHEHLDYHKTMDEYARAKRRLFEQLRTDSVAVLNADDERFEEYKRHTKARVISYGTSAVADYRISGLESRLEGLHFTLTVEGESYDIQTKLYGEFHAFNMTAALAACVESMGLDRESGIASLSEFRGVDGRMQAVHEQQNFAVIVDFAVTPRAIEHSLKTIRSLNPKRVWTITSTAGERDKTRRPRISQLFNEYADEVIFTSDLVFGENIVSIVNDLAQYVDPAKLHIIYDRQAAIRFAIMNAQEGDVVLIMGLGDIRFIIIQDQSFYHDDYEYARHAITERLTTDILKQQVEEAGAKWNG